MAERLDAIARLQARLDAKRERRAEAAAHDAIAEAEWVRRDARLAAWSYINGTRPPERAGRP